MFVDKNREEVTLIFPPMHDFSMPYLALPLLKTYIEDRCNIHCRIEDFNLKLIAELLKKSDFIKQKSILQSHIKNHDLLGSLNQALKLEAETAENLNISIASACNEDNYRFSLSKVSTHFDVYQSENIFNEIMKDGNLFVEFFDSFLKDKKYIRSKLFGISICFEDQILPSFSLAKAIRSRFKDAIVVMGGNIVTRLYENIIKSKLSHLVDYLIVKEGEDALCELVKAIILKEGCILNPKIIPICDSNLDNRRIKMKGFAATDIRNIRPPIFNFKNMDYYLAPLSIRPIFLSRRCYWAKCDFCSIYSSWDKTYRVRDLDNVLETIKQHHRAGIRHFRIVDEDCHPKLLNNFADKLISNGLSIYYEAYSRFESEFLEKAFCEKLFNSGCRQLFFGLESIGEYTLRLIKKGSFYTKDNIAKVLKNTSNARILNSLFLIMGIPGTPENDEKETIDFIINNIYIHRSVIASFLIDKNSPTHLSGSVREKYGINKIFEIGDMTTEIGYLFKNKDIKEGTKLKSKKYINQVFRARPDLALNFLMNEELRFILACEFGNNFSKSYLAKCSIQKIQEIIERALRKNFDERIERKIGSYVDVGEN